MATAVSWMGHMGCFHVDPAGLETQLKWLGSQEVTVGVDVREAFWVCFELCVPLGSPNEG